ncbi:MAG: 16S rRNA (cytosine(1402)-N(4))-methyltransferase RsmH [Bacteroidetes bacterium]|nr:16S rRNA (cytosine(1402)-N(4))-methyltransferase RsmH [Bacteroidota bacterium]
MQHHIPVLLNECLEYLVTNESGIYFDGTIGFGGHTSEILKKLNSDSKVVATDKDINAFNYCKELFKNDDRVKLFNTGFTDINTVSKIESIKLYDGIFADLGVSSFQLDDAASGFTYRADTKLDLRMDKTKGVPAYEIINKYEEKELADIFYKYGEEKKSRLISKKIVEERKLKKITGTIEFRKIIESVVPERFAKKTLSRIFQALRIYVNNELNELKIFLEKSVPLLKQGGRIVILTYHSLEDRIVKDHFNFENLDCICPREIPICVCGKERRLKILTKKPLIPSEDELRINPRSRSAKLRAAVRL